MKLKLLGWNQDELDKYPSFDLVETYQPQFPQIVDPVQLGEDSDPFIMVTCERTAMGNYTPTPLAFSPNWFIREEIEE